jgi:hypothetical protein
LNDSQEQQLWARLTAIHSRIKWMADREMQAASVNGEVADGHFWPEKLRLCDETDRILDQLEQGLKRN